MKHRKRTNGAININELSSEMIDTMNSPTPVMIIGAGTFLNDIMALLNQCLEYDVAGILDPSTKLHGQHVQNVPVMGWLENIPAGILTAVIGTPSVPNGFDREAVYHILRKRDISLPILCSDKSSRDQDVTLGSGTILLADSLVKRGAVIGDNCLIGPESVIGDAVVLNDHTVVDFRERLSSSVVQEKERIRPRSIAAATALETESIQEIIRKINWANMEIMLTTDAEGVLTGSVTDGDVRRGILAGIDLKSPVSVIMNRNPHTVPIGTSHGKMLEIMSKYSIKHLPVVDNDMRPVCLELMETLVNDLRERDALVMAGGLGERLRPYTEKKPKPLLSIGGCTILDHILSGLYESGLDDVVISVRYMEDKIRNHVGDGSDHKLNVSYLSERDRLGTAGALSMIRPKPANPFLMMNGDLLTDLDFAKLLRFQQKHGYKIVMCVRKQAFEVAYGVVDIKEGKVDSLKEKPVYDHFINAGIYVVDPSCIDLVPKDSYCDMPTLINSVLDSGEDVGAFPIIEYWRDIGTPEDLKQAKNEKENIVARYSEERMGDFMDRMTA